ncbi:MAG: carboxymuconolactone decarboxylase family protein [Chromatiales bacterium]|nr:carboxymuconolactone decarboxylase family protein [Chromatiales bacterium]
MQDDDSLGSRLAAIRQKRGYLLPHHGLLALGGPGLLEAYDALYSALALEQRVLSRHDHEFVWLAVLLAVDEALATHHVAKFQKAGGTLAEVEDALAISATTIGWSAWSFAGRFWRPHLPELDAHAAYLAAFRRASGQTPLRLAHLAGAAIHTCRQAWDGLAVQIQAGYADGIVEDELAEALTLTMFSGSVPNFVEGAGVWRELISQGRVPASPRFQAWATVPGQGGFDEAAGVDGQKP